MPMHSGANRRAARPRGADTAGNASSQAAAHRKALTDLPAEAKTHMKAETCTPASREQLLKNLAN